MATVEDPRWPDEAALVSALQTGDAAAFRALVTALHGPLVRMARGYVSPALADEVVQDTWEAVITAVDGFEGRSSVKSWIYRIMLNKVITLARRESRTVPFASAGPAHDTARPAMDPERFGHPQLGASFLAEVPRRFDLLPDEVLLSAEVIGHVAQLAEKLPDAQREVFVMRDMEGWTSIEVCDALGISAVNQRVLLHRARTALRSALEDYLDG